MTVRQIASKRAFIGLNSDTKPTGVPIGVRFFEYDTGFWYITYDGTNYEILETPISAVITELDAYVISDRDTFDVADADADTERWDIGYIAGTEGGSADINTTTAGKLMVKVDPDATPTTARYGVSHALPFYADFFSVMIDLSCTWGATDSGTAKATGILISAGTAYDATNYIAIERQKGTAINRFTASGKFNNIAIATANADTTDDAVALKIERWDNVWRCYYSTTQNTNYIWTLLVQYEDPNVYMTDQCKLFIESYSPGSADAESVQGDFDNFYYYIGAGGGGQYIAGDYNSAWVSTDGDGNVFERLEVVQVALAATAAGKPQITAKTVDLQQAIGTYDLFTGSTQDVLLESLSFRLPNVNVSDDVNITSISIQSDDATAWTFIPAALGAKANLTANSEIGWTGTKLLDAGKKIQLSIAGGAADASTVCDVVCLYRAVVSGGTLS